MLCAVEYQRECCELVAYQVEKMCRTFSYEGLKEGNSNFGHKMMI